MTAAERLRLVLRCGLPTVEETVREIGEELAFHVDMRTEELVRQGLDPVAARREAEARFGDMERIDRQCRRIRLKERIMLQKIQTVLTLGLIAAVVATAAQSCDMREETSQKLDDLGRSVDRLSAVLAASRAPARTPDRWAAGSVIESSPFSGEATTAPDVGDVIDPHELDSATWLARFLERPFDVRHGLAIAERLAALPGRTGVGILKAIWSDLPPAHKPEALTAFFFSKPPDGMLEALHLGATDSGAAVQEVAFGHLIHIAFQDFRGDPGGYAAWAARYGEAPLAEVIPASSRDLVARLDALAPADLVRALEALDGLHHYKRTAMRAGVDLAAALRDAGAPAVLERALTSGEPELAKRALSWANQIDPPEDWLRRNVLPLLQPHRELDDSVVRAACQCIGREGFTWAREPLLQLMEQSLLQPAAEGGMGVSIPPVAQALARLGDPAVVPRMIAAIVAKPPSKYDIAWFGLRPLTGVRYDESHDGDWWIRWWDENRHHFPPAVRSIEIPR